MRRPLRSRRAPVAAAVVLALLTTGAAGCGGRVDAPTISVVTSIYPLAQAVAAIGGSTVRVDDLARAGTDPLTMRPGAAQVAAMDRAAVVVEVGGGFQPAVEAAAAHAPRTVTLAPRFGPADDDLWLDPGSMVKALPVITDALVAANPRAASSYRDGEEDYYEQISSAANDYEDALTSCPKDQIAGPDAELGAVARQYRLHLHQLGTSAHPSAGQVMTAADTVSANGIGTVFSEPWVPDGTVRQAAAEAGARVRSYDTMLVPPSSAAQRGLDYVQLLESDLGTLAGAFGCPSNTDSQN